VRLALDARASRKSPLGRPIIAAVINDYHFARDLARNSTDYFSDTRFLVESGYHDRDTMWKY
jgi:hypothetical protein